MEYISQKYDLSGSNIVISSTCVTCLIYTIFTYFYKTWTCFLSLWFLLINLEIGTKLFETRENKER